MPQKIKTVNFGHKQHAGQAMNLRKKKVMLVTGAAGGLGSALSKIAADNGWRVIMLDVNRKGIERVYDDIIASGGTEPILHPMDLAMSGPEHFDQLVSAIEAQEGRLDALVHCAVEFKGLQPLDLIAPEDWLRQIQVSINAPWLLSTRCLPLLKKNQLSRIVFVHDGHSESKSLWGAYNVGKAAVYSLAAQFQAELSKTPVYIQVVDPGPMRTPLRASVFHSEDPSSVENAAVKASALFKDLNISSQKPEFLLKL